MSNEAEAAVRRYLAYLDDPSSVVDQDLVRAAEEAFEAASDPLAKLHAAADLERARAADPSGIEDEFVRHAKAYSAAEDIPAEAFAAVGVPGDVLERAGLAGARPRRSGGRRSSSGPRAPQVPVSQIKAAVSQLPKRFTLAQVAERAGGGSPATVRKAVEELIIEGRVTSLGPKPDHSGPGRAPTLYEQV
ncbi:MAG: hypothetical protein KDB04_18695 [Acidimicrobiales bacterium]|nr:hypothetical protein [Acidimicrobiales bacterium]HRW37749.1 hypothetical protein [Aquihabitans sp.]